MKRKRNYSRWLHVAISWGASVVIIGVLFKILHIGGALANNMIGLGLGVEAFLFFLMGFNPPAKQPEWSRVYPQLDDNYTEELPETALSPISQGQSLTSSLDKMFSEANIELSTIENLGKGLKDFGEKVSTINKISDISFATDEFTQKLRAASSKFDSLNLAFEKASKNLTDMASISSDSIGYHEQVQNLTANLNQLNNIYEKELLESTSYLQSMNHFYENLNFTMKNFNDSLDDSKAFKDEVNKLARNLNALNAVYGNMLNAMNQPRV